MSEFPKVEAYLDENSKPISISYECEEDVPVEYYYAVYTLGKTKYHSPYSRGGSTEKNNHGVHTYESGGEYKHAQDEHGNNIRFESGDKRGQKREIINALERQQVKRDGKSTYKWDVV